MVVALSLKSCCRCRETRCRGSKQLKCVTLSLIMKALISCDVVVVAKHVVAARCRESLNALSMSKKRNNCRVPSSGFLYTVHSIVDATGVLLSTASKT